MQNNTFKAILLLSGGIDSTTVLYDLNKRLAEVHCLIFDYGQTLGKEIDYAIDNAKRLNQPYKVIQIDLDWIGSKCSILYKNDTKISKNRTFDEINAATPSSYVEFRNGIFLAYAVAYGEAQGISDIYGGFNGVQSGQYPDDTCDFVYAFGHAARSGTAKGNMMIHGPWCCQPKYNIVKAGVELGIDYLNHTWSCYTNGKEHCGQCDSCKQREQAFIEGGYYEKIQGK